MNQAQIKRLRSAANAARAAADRVEAVLDEIEGAGKPASQYGIKVRPGRDAKGGKPFKRGKAPVSSGMGKDGKQRRK